MLLDISPNMFIIRCNKRGNNDQSNHSISRSPDSIHRLPAERGSEVQLMSIDSLGTHFNGVVAQEINRWIPKDEVPELTALASAVIKQAVKDDIR